MMKHLLLLLCILLAGAGCVAPIHHNTASGKPEVTVSTTDLDTIKGILISKMLNRGYSITRESDYLLTFDQPTDNILAAALLGSSYDSTPNLRISYNIAKIGDSIRVVANLAVITNPGSAFERRTNMNNSKDSPKIQSLLNQIAVQLDHT